MRIPDLVIAELYMDGMDGIEFLRRVHEIWPDEPVLVMSSRAPRGAVAILDLVRHLGAVGLLEKPVVEDRLIEAVSDILPA